MAKQPSYIREVNTAFEYMLEEYCSEDIDITETIAQIDNFKIENSAEFDAQEEEKVIKFLNTPCQCSKNCQKQLSKEEVINNRKIFSSLGKAERNYIILYQLKTFLTHSNYAISARSMKNRERKKFDYRISIDRPVCKTVFLFYYGETMKRLDRLKRHVTGESIAIPVHGHIGRIPGNAYTLSDKEWVKSFISNFAMIHGLPDPGRDVRKGKGRLRILLPSITNYYSVHLKYSKNIKIAGGTPISYRTFIKIWREEFPQIKFNDPKSDLCMTCEGFKKRLNQIAASLDENKEKTQEKIHKEALDHLKLVKKERLYYQANTKIANKYYRELLLKPISLNPNKPNSRDIVSHYSWDFAQQLHYPFEEQQVGPIYFKTPRKAQLFGVCNEGIPQQYNYLIDEEDVPTRKGANMVISLLDHFFSNYGLGEKWVHLTADNCVGQNKNNALLQYLMYRVFTGLHSKIELSFLIVGHTKFSPDGYFGLIKRLYRRSQVYTYEQLENIVENSSKNGHNVCIGSTAPPIIYRDWTSWLEEYFMPLKGISNYHHFKIENKKPILLKERKNSKEIEVELLKKKLPIAGMPKQLFSTGLSLKRQWYLYDEIRCHIPSEMDKEQTCPRPIKPKSEIKNEDK